MGVPRAGLLRFNKCHCGPLCQLHKQVAIYAPCIFCPFMVSVLEAQRTFSNPLFMQGRSTEHGGLFSAPFLLRIYTVTFTHGSCPVYYQEHVQLGVQVHVSVVVAEYCSFTFSTNVSRKHVGVKLGTLLTSLGCFFVLFVCLCQGFMTTCVEKHNWNFTRSTQGVLGAERCGWWGVRWTGKAQLLH